jgi:hypothetical protein
MLENFFADPRILLLGALTGVIFGFLLQKGGVTRYNVIVNQFRFRDFTVLKTMLTAIVVGAVGVYAMQQTGMIKGLHVKAAEIGMNAVGGAIFGVGMVLLGYCPGTALAAVGQGSRDAAVGVGGGPLRRCDLRRDVPASCPDSPADRKPRQDHLRRRSERLAVVVHRGAGSRSGAALPLARATRAPPSDAAPHVTPGSGGNAIRSPLKKDFTCATVGTSATWIVPFAPFSASSPSCWRLPSWARRKARLRESWWPQSAGCLR